MKKSLPTTLREAIAADNAAWRAENKIKEEAPAPVVAQRTVINAPRPTKQDNKRKQESIQLSHLVERAQEKHLQARPTNGFRSRAVRPVNWGPDTPPAEKPTEHPKSWAIGNAFDQLQFVLGQVRVEPPRR